MNAAMGREETALGAEITVNYLSGSSRTSETRNQMHSANTGIG